MSWLRDSSRQTCHFPLFGRLTSWSFEVRILRNLPYTDSRIYIIKFIEATCFWNQDGKGIQVWKPEIIGYPADESYFDYSIAMNHWCYKNQALRRMTWFKVHIPFHNRNSSQDSLPNYFLISKFIITNCNHILFFICIFQLAQMFFVSFKHFKWIITSIFWKNVRNFRAYLAPSPASMASSSFLYLSWKLKLPAMFSRQLGWCMKCQKYPTKLQEKGWKRCPTIFSHVLLQYPFQCHVANSNWTDIQDKLRSLWTQVS